MKELRKERKLPVHKKELRTKNDDDPKPMFDDCPFWD